MKDTYYNQSQILRFTHKYSCRIWWCKFCMAKYNYLIYRVCFSNIYLFLYTLYPCPTEILFQKIKIIWSFQINKHIILSGVNINSCLVHLISDLFSVIQWINVLPYGDYFTLEANTKIRKPASPTSHYKYRHAKSRDFHLWSLHLQEVILNSWSYITLTFLQKLKYNICHCNPYNG